jgi:hypothetical protein
VPNPAYRASLVKSVMAAYRAHPDPVYAEILDQVGEETLARVHRASRLDWIPAAVFDGINGITWDRLGDEGYEAFWVVQTKAALEMPLFGAIAKGALSMFGVGPTTLLRFVGKGWERTTRDYGRVEHRIGDRRFELSLLDLPEVGRLRTVALSMKASLTALMETAGEQGTSEMDLSAIDAGRVEFVATW